MFLLGVDPGLQGGITVLDGNSKIIICVPMPTIKAKTRELNTKVIRGLLIEHMPTCVILERQHTMPKQAAGSTFNTGARYGQLQGLVIHQWPLQIITAKQWQRTMFYGYPQGGDLKGTSALVAMALWPDFDFTPTERATKIHDGMTDSALICEWGRRHLKFEGGE